MRTMHKATLAKRLGLLNISLTQCRVESSKKVPKIYSEDTISKGILNYERNVKTTIF